MAKYDSAPLCFSFKRPESAKIHRKRAPKNIAMSSRWIHVQQFQDLTIQYHPMKKPNIYMVNSPSDIDWRRPLNLKGGPDPTKTFEELCMLRSNIPKINDDTFQQIFPSDNILCITQKTGRHFVHLREATAWIINGTHWFSVLKQPVMVIIWCRDWDEASKFQYLMQILQVHLWDYIPKYQTFVQQEEDGR